MSKSWIPPQGEYISTDGIVTDNIGTTLTSKLASIDSSLAAVVPIERGGTNANNATTARTNLGLGSMGAADEKSTTKSVSLAHEVAKNLMSVTLPAGSYILMGGCTFAANSTGVRALNWSATSNQLNNGGIKNNGMKVPACNSGVTGLKAFWLVTLSKNTTYYLVGQQNSGSALNADAYYRYIRIK